MSLLGERDFISAGILMHRGAAPKVGEDFVVGVLVHMDERADVEVGMVNDAQRTKGRIGVMAKNRPWTYAPDPERALFEGAAGFGAEDFQHGVSFNLHEVVS